MKTINFLLLLTFITNVSIHAKVPLLDLVYGKTVVVSDPIQALLQSTTHSPDEALWRANIDLRGKGKADMLLAFDHDNNSKAGKIWSIFLQQSDGSYMAIPDNISFRFDATTVTKLPGDTVAHLIAYYPGGAQSGSLVKFVVTGTKIEQQIITSDLKPEGKDAEFFSHLFAKEKLVEIVNITKQHAEVMASTARAMPPTPAPTITPPSVSQFTPTLVQQPASTPVVKPETPHFSSQWLLIFGGILFLFAGVLFFLRRNSNGR